MSHFPVDVVRSKRRTRTAQAGLREGRIEVTVPDGMDPDEEAKVVQELVTRVVRRSTSAGIDLVERASDLATRYRLPTPDVIEWSDRQMKTWGTCSPSLRRIRISRRLASMPSWVLDSVVIHELAHLVVAGHGPEFRELVDRYELSERAKGYLMATSRMSA
jgi:predicted metal-dependent hydrolase